MADRDHRPSIDFLIIGAQKAGTTSLFEYMRRHPEIHMPAEKEISFFSRDYDRGYDWYIATVLRNAPSDALCGEASIGYMGGTPFADIAKNEQGYWPADEAIDKPLEAVIPRRIKMNIPDVRLICVLRDPVARAYSHYQMSVLGKTESRTFNETVRELLAPDALREARIVPTTTNGYIVNGEYHRILAGFLDVFSSEQLLVVFSNELADYPIPTLERVFEFVGARPFLPDNLDTRYRAAATKQRISGLDLYAWQARIAKSSSLRWFWHALPDRIHAAIDRAYCVASYRVAMWNALRGSSKQEMAGDDRARLIEHFRPDSEALSRLLDLDVPWLATW